MTNEEWKQARSGKGLVMDKKGIKVLSVFDGMSCGRIALKRAGIDVGTYYASELDKYAIKVTQANWPETIQLGDITKWREWDIDWASIDLLIGGSPCQGFSFAGKQLAFDDPRSALFFVYVDILEHIRRANSEVKFLLENVRMKKEYLTVITEYLGCEPVFINSTLVSAQNRQRYYWTNINKIEQPTNKGFTLKDILEEKVDTTYFFQDRIGVKITGLNSLNKIRVSKRTVDQKARCLTAGGQSITNAGATNIILGDKLRKLTPVECERLQTVPDNYTNHVSNSQRYKMLGNGWTVDVIAHIFKSIKVSTNDNTK